MRSPRRSATRPMAAVVFGLAAGTAGFALDAVAVEAPPVAAAAQPAETAAAAMEEAQDTAPVDQGRAADESGPEIETVSDGVSTIRVVDHGDSWSMHVENVPTDRLLGLWHQVGGPELIAKTVIDRPYTISVHRLSAERILERLLDAYDYTLHYDGRGHLVRARVYSLDPGTVFKTPRLVESLADWREEETPAVGSDPDVP